MGVREAVLGCVAGKKIRFFPPGTEAKKGDCAPFLEFPPRGGGIFLRLWAAGEGRKKTEILRPPKSCCRFVNDVLHIRKGRKDL